MLMSVEDDQIFVREFENCKERTVELKFVLQPTSNKPCQTFSPEFPHKWVIQINDGVIIQTNTAAEEEAICFGTPKCEPRENFRYNKMLPFTIEVQDLQKKDKEKITLSKATSTLARPHTVFLSQEFEDLCKKDSELQLDAIELHCQNKLLVDQSFCHVRERDVS